MNTFMIMAAVYTISVVVVGFLVTLGAKQTIEVAIYKETLRGRQPNIPKIKAMYYFSFVLGVFLPIYNTITLAISLIVIVRRAMK